MKSKIFTDVNPLTYFLTWLFCTMYEKTITYPSYLFAEPIETYKRHLGGPGRGRVADSRSVSVPRGLYEIVVDRLQTGNSIYQYYRELMMTSSNGNFFRVTGPLCGEFTGHRWIPRTKAGDAELFLLSTPE